MFTLPLFALYSLFRESENERERKFMKYPGKSILGANISLFSQGMVERGKIREIHREFRLEILWDIVVRWEDM